MYLKQVYYDELNNPTEVILQCNNSNKEISISNMDMFSKIQSEYCILVQHIECECGNSCSAGIIEYKKMRDSNINKSPVCCVQQAVSPTRAVVQCPYCHSSNTKKISTTSKVINTAVWGILGTKRHKQWHCNNCKSDF